MRSVCYEIAAVAVGRMQILLRSARHYPCADLVCQYKAQVLSSIAYATLAIYHAPEFFLKAIDQVQEIFLSELEMSASDILLDLNLAPFNSRRYISMLRLIHRIVLKDFPVQCPKYIYDASADCHRRGWVFKFDRHNHQLHDRLNCLTPKNVERLFFN